MTNEIKEILEALKPHSDIVKEYPLTLSIEEQKILLDYITNLQKENERLKDYLKIMEKGKDNNLYRFLDYKQRIDKAVEYINKYEYQKYCPGPYEKDKYIMREEKEGQDLLDILRGDE